MEAVMYLKEKERMCNSQQDGCDKCVLVEPAQAKVMSCLTMEAEHPEKAVALVEQWSKEHLVKTYAQEFFEKFPNASRSDAGTPNVCIKELYGEEEKITMYCSVASYTCSDCWNRPMPEVE